MSTDHDQPEEEPQFAALSRDDKDMALAHCRAAGTLEDFKAHLRIHDDRLCSVKLRFRDPDASERFGEDRFVFIWLGNAHYHEDEGMFSAEFFELPKEFQKWHHVGERLGVDPEDIFDWMAIDAGRLYGGFTLRVARDRLPAEKRADYDSYVGVSHYEQATLPKQQAEQAAPSGGERPQN